MKIPLNSFTYIVSFSFSGLSIFIADYDGICITATFILLGYKINTINT